MPDFLSVYITCKDAAEAEAIALKLVEEKLAACVNILPGVTSIYSWQGQTEKAPEIMMLAKTRATRFDKLAARVRELHSYETPCIVAFALAAGDKDFLNWIKRETA